LKGSLSRAGSLLSLLTKSFLYESPVPHFDFPSQQKFHRSVLQSLWFVAPGCGVFSVHVYVQVTCGSGRIYSPSRRSFPGSLDSSVCINFLFFWKASPSSLFTPAPRPGHFSSLCETFFPPRLFLQKFFAGCGPVFFFFLFFERQSLCRVVGGLNL